MNTLNPTLRTNRRQPLQWLLASLLTTHRSGLQALVAPAARAVALGRPRATGRVGLVTRV